MKCYTNDLTPLTSKQIIRVNVIDTMVVVIVDTYTLFKIHDIRWLKCPLGWPTEYPCQCGTYQR